MSLQPKFIDFKKNYNCLRKKYFKFRSGANYLTLKHTKMKKKKKLTNMSGVRSEETEARLASMNNSEHTTVHKPSLSGDEKWSIYCWDQMPQFQGKFH